MASPRVGGEKETEAMTTAQKTIAARVTRFVQGTAGRLRLFCLPYSPELNPDELARNHVKTHGVWGSRLTGPDHLNDVVLRHLRALHKSPTKIRGFFH